MMTHAGSPATPRRVPQRGLRRALDINAAPERVYQALTSLGGLRGWWTTLVRGDTTAGGEIRFEFAGLEEYILMRVQLAEPARRVQWQCLAHTGLPEWNGTTLTFRLAPRPRGRSRLTFRHLGLVPSLACYEDCRQGWDYFLSSLVRYVEQGVGTPYGA